MARYEVWIIMNSASAMLVDKELERHCEVEVSDVITEENLASRFEMICKAAWQAGRIPTNEKIELVTYPEEGEFIISQGNA